MSFSDSLFLFEFVVEEMTSWVDLKEVLIKCQLADIFTIDLKNPFRKKTRSKKLQRNKFRQKLQADFPITAKSRKIEAILFELEPKILMSTMVNNPMEISLWGKSSPSQRLASALFPQNKKLFYFLKKSEETNKSITICQEQYVFDEISSRRIASIKLNIVISHLKERTKEDLISTVIPEPKKDINILYNDVNDPGIIKTTYSNRTYAKKIAEVKKKRKYKWEKQVNDKDRTKNLSFRKKREEHKKIKNNEVYKILSQLSKSDTNINSKRKMELLESRSLSNLNGKERVDLYKHIFGNMDGPLKNKIYWVNYFSIQNNITVDQVRSTSLSKSSNMDSPDEKSSETCVSGPCKGRFKFKICDSECPSRKTLEANCSRNSCNVSDDLKQTPSTIITRCKNVNCEYKDHRKPLPAPDDAIYIDANKVPCCKVKDTFEEVVGNMKANMKFGTEEDPCYCTCECRFGFTKKTTYCGICGGFENIGEDLNEMRALDLPHPCPIYHKLEKVKSKAGSATGSDSKKKKGKPSASGNSEAEKEGKKSKKKRKNDRFKFNYGYKAPQIGHSQCAMPCTGALGAVPKDMGWLWTANNIPGLKFRPTWKPGAVNKYVLRLLRIAKNPDEAFAKKRRKDIGQMKRPLKRPLLVVHKKDGEYTVTMETMKNFTKPRTVNQYPYEDKPLVTYTVGRTEEENRERQKKKERAKRRLERAQRRFIQSTFTDMCKDICLKTYQQALGILPFAEEHPCLCYPEDPDAEHTNLDVSCSCSEDKSMTDSDTDLDEWVVEFTPPNAFFDQNQVKGKKLINVDNDTQYSYLDYRVLLLDRLGNPVPRFFIGPDGKQQCSDLGGFWSPSKKWLVINVDGYVGPDRRWAPNCFLGPNGEQIDTDTGKFQAMNGNWLVVGVDGYIDKDNKWRFYPKSRSPTLKKPKVKARLKNKGAGGDKTDSKAVKNGKSAETAFSCFGDTSPRYLSELGKMGHGHDRKILLAALRDLLAKGEDVKIPTLQTIPKFPRKKRRIQSHEVLHKKNYYEDIKCHHATPSTKGIIAVNADGNKVYFRLRESKNRRPKMRLDMLEGQGISLSSFHMPCLHSFINSEEMKMRQRQRLEALVPRVAQNPGL